VISLRYHIVTIVAVFLALAVGLLAGSAFVEPELVDQLRTRTDDLRDRVAQLEGDLTQARAEVDALDGFVDAALPYLTVNRLLGHGVVVVAQEGVEDALVGQTQRSLVEAGATVVAVLSARHEIASEDPDTRARLAEVLGEPAADPEALPELTASAIAARLANGDDGAEVDEDLLARLLSEGFLTPVGSGLSEEALAEIGADGQVVVVLGGGQAEEPPVPPEVFMVPLVEQLMQLGLPVAAGESATTAVGFVEAVRGADGLVTVDDLDLTMGGAALVLGLDELLDTGQGGVYGIKDGAEPLPTLS
jgi:outer membrane murein-binding lipoprotein Lpp